MNSKDGIDFNWEESYWANGYVRIKSVFTSTEISELKMYFDEVYTLGTKQPYTKPKKPADFIFVEKKKKRVLKFAKWPSLYHKGFNTYREHPKLISLITKLLGPSLKQIVNQLHWKIPGDNVSFQFHQDATFRKPASAYKDVYSNFVQSALIVDECTKENGAIEFFDKSHLSKKELLVQGYGGWEENDTNTHVTNNFGNPTIMQANEGDVLIWNPYTIHGSPPNQSKFPRRVYINGFANANNCKNGVLILKDGSKVELRIDSKVKWDVVGKSF